MANREEEAGFPTEWLETNESKEPTESEKTSSMSIINLEPSLTVDEVKNKLERMGLRLVTKEESNAFLKRRENELESFQSRLITLHHIIQEQDGKLKSPEKPFKSKESDKPNDDELSGAHNRWLVTKK